MFETEEWLSIPYEEEKRLLQQYREARKGRDKEEERRCKVQLINLYVLYGEHFKMADKPDKASAKYCMKKALELQADHPVANYRYAYLMYQDRNYGEAAYYFKKALDGSRDECLDESQTIIANMFLVNCGLLIAKDAMKEVSYLRNNESVTYDIERIENYYEKMLIDSEEMIEQHLYCKYTPSGTSHISRGEFGENEEKISENEVQLRITDEYMIKFRGQLISLGKKAFFVFYTIIRSEAFVTGRDISNVLCAGSFESDLNDESIRQYLRRLSLRIPFWNDVIETVPAGNRTERRRRDGITYTLMCHSSVVLP